MHLLFLKSQIYIFLLARFDRQALSKHPPPRTWTDVYISVSSSCVLFQFILILILFPQLPVYYVCCSRWGKAKRRFHQIMTPRPEAFTQNRRRARVRLCICERVCVGSRARPRGSIPSNGILQISDNYRTGRWKQSLKGQRYCMFLL